MGNKSIPAEALSLIASRLSQRTAEVRLRAPAVKNTIGLATFQPNNRVIIDIDPALPANQFYQVFLHECGHARSHYFEPLLADQKVVSQLQAAAPASIHEGYAVPDVDREAEADRWVKYWDFWARFRLGDQSDYFDRMLEFLVIQ